MFIKFEKNDLVLVSCLGIWALVNFFCMSISSPYCGFDKYLLTWVVGLACNIYVANCLSSKQMRHASVVLWLVHISIIVYLLLFTSKIRGSKRWLIFRPGMSYQPSEGLKLFYIILFSNFLTSKKYYRCFGVFAITVSCLVLQPDLGNAALVSIITIILLIQSGMNKIIIASFGCVLSLGAVIAICIFPHSRYRYKSFFSKAQSHQNIRALAAIKAGGLAGVGAGKGSIKNVLPDAYSDFVFAVIGEELGFLGCTLICASFLVFILRIWYFYSILPRLRESLWFLGIGLLISLQAWIHMASSVWLIPPKGTNLPFISHGGTSLIIFHISFGILVKAIEVVRKKWITGYQPDTLVKSWEQSKLL